MTQPLFFGSSFLLSPFPVPPFLSFCVFRVPSPLTWPGTNSKVYVKLYIVKKKDHDVHQLSWLTCSSTLALAACSASCSADFSSAIYSLNIVSLSSCFVALYLGSLRKFSFTYTIQCMNMNIDSWVEKQLITYTARSYYILQCRYTIITVSDEILSVGLSHTVFLKIWHSIRCCK